MFESSYDGGGPQVRMEMKGFRQRKSSSTGMVELMYGGRRKDDKTNKGEGGRHGWAELLRQESKR